MMFLTERQSGEMSGLMRHERASLLAHVHGKAHRQMLMDTSFLPVFRMASQMVS